MEVALWGGNFNPPGVHHAEIARALAEIAERVVIVPAGPRSDKHEQNAIACSFRAALVDIAFRGIPRIELDFSDLENQVFTTNDELTKRYPDVDLWHVVPYDFVEGGASSESLIQRWWQGANELWNQAKFLIVHDQDCVPNPEDLPPHHRLMEVRTKGRSLDIRSALVRGENVSNLMDPAVLGFIESRGLYRLSEPAHSRLISLDGRRGHYFFDPRNQAARDWAKRFSGVAIEEADYVVALGGDGTMLRAIEDFWERRIPFFGVNFGHLGFLLNDREDVTQSGFPAEDVIVRDLPLLRVESTLLDGSTRIDLAFNDAWLERSTGQTAWFELQVDQHPRFDKLVCDGILACTAAGSTAYAASMGATPMLADTEAWMLVGSNVMTPRGWKSAPISMNSTIAIRNLDPRKRPTQAFIGGKPLGEVTEMRIRPSRTAFVELAFLPEHDMAKKIANMHFPSG
ncbi:putative inorganic polyphosphate/ATP-NAD kinase [Rubripirellula obstinata]|uniref:Putative inorganic polyphosphate/ATP-NAD kinase n=1 Tax=Rubripirellula obstinata TaxID=406547 RepID=A0A5B1CN70_9BACT|nr:NAD(+)/NADH kinase [Rubripirellula obstinata]KAA1261741.1 putative inorganic polyphosphate/ATP-NAD kinase [Rubripirellula obstinata]